MRELSWCQLTMRKLAPTFALLRVAPKIGT